MCFFLFIPSVSISISPHILKPISLRITHPSIFVTYRPRGVYIDSAGFWNDVIFILQHFCFVWLRSEGVMMCKWLPFECENWKLHQHVVDFVFYLYDHRMIPIEQIRLLKFMQRRAASKTWNLFLFFARGFSLCRVGDTHLNGIVLLFNGDVNYSAVKTSHDTHRKFLFKFGARRINIRAPTTIKLVIVHCLVSYQFVSFIFFSCDVDSGSFLCGGKWVYCCDISTFDSLYFFHAGLVS